MRFLAELPHTTLGATSSRFASPKKLTGGVNFDRTLPFTMQKTTNMFGGTMRMPATTLGSPKGLPDKIIETGYNLGFNKGSFATAFDSREYFE